MTQQMGGAGMPASHHPHAVAAAIAMAVFSIALALLALAVIGISLTMAILALVISLVMRISGSAQTGCRLTADSKAAPTVTTVNVPSS